jgi:hypothetical protein
MDVKGTGFVKRITRHSRDRLKTTPGVQKPQICRLQYSFCALAEVKPKVATTQDLR